MSDTMWVVFVAAALSAFFGWLIWRRYREGNPRATEAVTPAFRRNFKGVSPVFKANIYKRESPVTAREMELIDKACSRARDVAGEWGFGKGLDFSAYDFELERPNPKCNGQGFLIESFASPYDGSDYDRDKAHGRTGICAAEWATGLTSYPGEYLATSSGDHIGVINGRSYQRVNIRVVNDPLLITDAAYYGIEHELLAANDLGRFWQTAYHGPDVKHPLL